MLAEPIPAERRTAWSPGVVGGIPTYTTVYQTVSAGVSLATLNSHLDACPSNQVVFMNPGTYTFAGAIVIKRNETRNGGVALRGSGAYTNGTKIVFTAHAGNANVVIGEETVNRVDDTDINAKGAIVDWTAGYAQNATVITLSSVTGLSPGKMITLDQLNNNSWVEDDVQEGCNYCGRASGERSQAQRVRVVSVAGNDVTISPGLRMPNWSATYSPQAWWTDAAETAFCGIENLQIESQSGSGLFGVYSPQSQNCWVKDCSITNSAQAAIETSVAMNFEVTRTLLTGLQSGGSQSYGMVWYMASEGLMIDCIGANITGAMNFGPQASGNVVAYSYFTNLIYSPSNWNIAALASHDGHVNMNLIEGCHANTVYFDSIHGSASHNTIFRNRLTGLQPGRTGNTFAYVAEQIVRTNNFLGNIVGTDGYHNSYWATNKAGCEVGDEFIYVLGTGDANCGNGVNALPFTWDDNVHPSHLIHGNYDYVTDSQTWDSGNADHTLANSYFLSSKPAFFGGMPWPPYNPANHSASSTTNTPAGLRWSEFINTGDSTKLFADAPESSGSSGVSDVNVTELRIGTIQVAP